MSLQEAEDRVAYSILLKIVDHFLPEAYDERFMEAIDADPRQEVDPELSPSTAQKTPKKRVSGKMDEIPEGTLMKLRQRFGPRKIPFR